MSCSVACVEMAELADDYSNNRMYWIERVRYRAHLATCRACREQLGREEASQNPPADPLRRDRSPSKPTDQL